MVSLSIRPARCWIPADPTCASAHSQLAGMLLVTLCFAMLGFLSPSSRGSIAQALFVFLLLFSYVAGYVSTIIYITYGGEVSNLIRRATPKTRSQMFLFSRGGKMPLRPPSYFPGVYLLPSTSSTSS